jgi:hypothetical protein
MWACEVTAHGRGLAYSYCWYRQWFLDINFLFFTWFLSCQSACLWACELTAHSPGLAHSHCWYRQWFFPSKFFFLSLEFWTINQLDCEHVSSLPIALGLLTATAGSGFLYVQFFFITWILRYQSTCMWACELTTHGPRLTHSHCRYRQCFFVH